ncbi:elongator complex protein 1-like isoform X3 [Glandiceps talaboti]
MTWSPDQELLILTTSRDTLIVMTKDFDPITEMDLHSEDFGEQKPMNVGWGKKETQFHGSAGKGAAVKKEDRVEVASEWDDGLTRVSWRGDGQLFAVTAINPQTGTRNIRIWNRECVLQSSGEKLNGLEQALVWKPSGSLIVSSQRLPHRHDVIFFEKNGLKHGEFTLPFDKLQVKVVEMMWNVDSTVLALWLEELPSEQAKAQENFTPKSYVQLWTSSNYHWYLKQNLEFGATREERVVAVQWDPEQGYCIHILCYGGDYLKYTWSWTTNHSRGISESDSAYVAVIDAGRVLLTPFRSAVVPPPMCAYYIQFSSNVNQVFFGSAQNSNDVGVVLADGTVALYEFTKGMNTLDDSVCLQAAGGGNGFKRTVSNHQLIGRYRIMSDEQPIEWNKPLNWGHFTWITENKILAVTMEANCSESRIYELRLENAKSTEGQLVASSSTIVDGKVYCIHSNTGDSVVIQLMDGSLLQFDTTTCTATPWTMKSGLQIRFPQPCVQMSVCQFAGEEAVLGLTERYRLYVNDTEVASNCTSFAVHQEFLLLTTHSHTCRCVSLNNPISALVSLNDASVSVLDESIRRVERGSRIVVAVPNDTKVILQMPRGNLEAIHPRALMLSAVKNHLEALQYKQAFIAMRKHRINMNLIYDHNPEVFINNVDKFVHQLDDINHFNLFLADLKAEDVTMSMYSAAYPKTRQSTIILTDKVDLVCDSVRAALQEINQSKYFLSIITTLIKKTKPELEAALLKIKMLKDNPSTDNSCSADEALKYVFYMVDVNDLYSVALGTYNFDLVVMVAEKSQMDPKEYLPFLNKLRKMESNYQKYNIDKHLKRFSQALVHISKCGEHWEECVQLIEQQEMFVEALQLFEIQSMQYKTIGQMYAEHLFGLRHYEEAAIMYAKCNQDEEALEMYVKCGNWRQSMCVAIKLEQSSDQLAQLARKLASNLHSHRQYEDAAYLLEYYVNDVEEAIVTLIEGSLWQQAVLVIYRHKRLDFIETNLRPGLLQNYNTYTTLLESMLLQFERQKARLQVVRETKEKRSQGLFDEDEPYDRDGDLFSETSSIGRSSYSSIGRSSHSQYSASNSKISGRSSKNRRKAERKKYSLKEGSEFEDLGLLEALSSVIQKVDKMKDDIASLLKVLVQYHYDKEAVSLQSTLDSVVQVIDKSVHHIWKTEIDMDSSSLPVLGPKSTANSIALAMMDATRSSKPLNVEELAFHIPPKINKDTKWKLHQLQTKS